MALNPVTLLIVGAVGAASLVATYTAFHYAEKTEGRLTIDDLRPAMPWEGLPIPIFLYTKPEVLESLRK